jgi:hypothetical protein
MITPDRTPINANTSKLLSKVKTNRIQTVEEALVEMGNRIASPDFGAFVRQLIEAGADVKYELKIKKSNSPGFVVALNYQAEAPKKSFGTLLGLL